MNTNTEKWSGKPPKPWAYQERVPPWPTVGTMMPVQRVEPGATSRSIPKSPPKMSVAEMDLDSYCREADRYPDLWPLHEPCFYLTECPECEKERPMALNDYICVKCRYA